MSLNPVMHVGKRPRPVTEAPVDSLLDRADELARRWAVALILARPLDRLGELPLEDLAREAPALCAQLIRALLSDVELERMAGGEAPDSRADSASARKLGALAGAHDAESAVTAVEALRGVLWEALLGELHDPPARLVADLADRLAYVCAAALSVTILATVAADPPAVQDGLLARAGSGPSPGEPEQSDTAVRGGVVIDERDEPPVAPRVSSPPAAGSAAAQPTRVRPFPWDMPPFESREPIGTSHAGSGPDSEGSRPEIEIRDERHEEEPAAWTSSIGRWLERFERDGLPFAVLLVELFDVERLARVALPGEFSALTSDVEAALGQELRVIDGARGDTDFAELGRPAGELRRERPGRYWLLVSSADGLAVRMLAERLVRALRPVARRRGAALPFALGMVVCPEDGRDVPALTARAEAGLRDARSAGRPIAFVDGSAEDLDLFG